MSTEQTPFTEAPAAPVAQPAPVEAAPTPAAIPTPIVIPDAVSHLVGEGKKYATLDVALAALEPAQNHIDKIESENAALRAANEKARNQEDILADWQQQVSAQPQQATPAPSVPATSTESISEIVNQQMLARDAAFKAKANTDEVTASMTKHYGTVEKAEAAYIEQATAMGLGVKGMNNLAASSPKAVLKMLGIEGQSLPPAPATTHGSVNTAALNQTPVSETPKSVMAGASHAQQKAAWQSFAPKD